MCFNTHKHILFRIILLTLFYIAPSAIFSQAHNTRIKFDNKSLEYKLTQSSVSSILQDSDGFMWFGTLDGLNKFDGYKVTPFRHNPKDSTSIPDNSINTIFESRDGTIWIGTRSKGMCMYDKINNRFINIKKKPGVKNSLSSDNVTAFFEDRKGILWIGTDYGLNRYDRKTKTYKHYKKCGDKTKCLSNNKINQIIADKSGNLWIATDEGLNKFNPKSENFTPFMNIAVTTNTDYNPDRVANKINAIFIDSKNILWIGTDYGLTKRYTEKGTTKFFTYTHNEEISHSIGSNFVTSIIEDLSGILWIGTEEAGLNRFNREHETFVSYKHDTSDPASLSVDHVLTIFLDKTNVLWIGTSLGGVSKWNRTVEGVDIFRHNPYDTNSLSASQVRTFYQDKNKDIWIGTVDGGLNFRDAKNSVFKRYVHHNGRSTSLSYNHVRSIVEDSEGFFWIGTDGGGLNKFDKEKEVFYAFKHNEKDPKSIANDKVWKVIEDKQKRLWVATYGGGLDMYDRENGAFIHFKNEKDNPNSISSDFVTTLLEDSKGRIWVGTFGGGLNRLNPMTLRFERFLHNENDTTSIGNDRIYSIIEDSDGIIWIGTKGNLNKFIEEDNIFIRYNEEQGLPNNVIMGIIEDSNKNLWLSTNKGLCKFNKKKISCRNYDVRDGLQSNEFLVGAFLKAQDGEMYFGGINGFNTFYPDEITDNKHTPEVLITGFQIFSKNFELDSNITEKKLIELEYDQNWISFEYVALNYIYPEKNQYKYYLKGKDKDTIYDKEKLRFAKYTDLEPGKYVFTVLGSNNDGKWNNKGASITIVIKPAFWQTLLFKIIVVLMIFGAAFFGYKIRIRSMERKRQHLEDLVKLRTAEIMSQKEEIEAQRDAIEVQRDEIETQRDIANEQRDKIKLQNQEIKDSIYYAQRIQNATLPSNEIIGSLISDHFVLFKPKDIVSGDFYWANTIDKKLILAAADCTGHGVPGAFMSMLGTSFLNKIVSERGISKPHEILNRLRSNVIASLHQKGLIGEAKDGMDAALCTLDTETGLLQFSGANNPLYIIRNKESEIIKGDKMPIAIYENMESFTTHEIQLEKGDCVFLFSDGFADQFGGRRGKKFKYKPFRELLIENSDKPMGELKELLNSTIEEWKSYPDQVSNTETFEQIDDILVIGIRF